MNYLAHIYLSGNDDDLLLGNFIGDFVKGQSWKSLPKRVGQGVLLHRFIDDYTDHHPICADLRSDLHPLVGKYAGVALDMLFDHFLASDWSLFEDKYALEDYTQQAYQRLEKRRDEMPDRAAFMFRVMREQDWLTGYRYPGGLQRALNGLYRRSGKRATGFEGLLAHEQLDLRRMRFAFRRFFPDLCRNSLLKINSFAGELP